MQQKEQDKFYNIENLQKFRENCFILNRDTFEDTCYTYGSATDAVRQLNIKFKEQNIPHKIGIALHLPLRHTPATCVLLLSVLEHNCYFCPLDATLLEEQLTANGAHFLITYEKQTDYIFLHTLQVFEEEFYLYKIIKCSKQDNLGISDDLSYCINTSGSTGTAKSVHVTYNCIASNIHALSELFEIKSQDVIYFGTPLTFDPSVVEFFLAINNGASLLLAKPTLRLASSEFAQALFPRACNKRGVSIMQMTPSNLRLFGTKSISEDILAAQSSLRILVLGGEEFPRRDELLRWYAKNGINKHKRIFNIYGITELSCWSTIHEYNHDSSCSSEEQRVPLGKPLDKTTIVRVVKPHTNIVASDSSQGELQIGSDTRRCLLTQDDLLCKARQNEIIFRSTGDLVEVDANANIYYLGRLNRIIKRHGKRLCLDALAKFIESILSRRFSQAVEAACLWQNKLICVLVLPDKSKLQQQNAQRVLVESLAKHNLPDCYMFIDQLPLTAHGKLHTRKLLTIWQNQNTTAAYAKSTPLNLFCNFLSKSLALSVSISALSHNHGSTKRSKTFLNESFYAAGGTSFQALSFSEEIAHVLATDEMQRTFLQMLLNANIKLSDILSYLQSCERTPTVQACALNERTEFNTGKIMQRWRADLQRCVDAAPASIKLASGRHCICIGSHAHLLLTLDACTGEELSRLKLPDRIECQVVFPKSKNQNSNMALVGCYDGFMYAFDYLNGSIYWRINAGGIVKARPLLLPQANCVVIASYCQIQNLMCICLQNQNVVWSCKLGDKGIFTMPILLPGNEESLLVCTLAGIYARLSSKCGSIEWQHQCESPIFSTPACTPNICNSLLVVAEVSGKVHFCNTTDGQILETFNANGNIFSGITVEQFGDENSAYVIFGCHDKSLYCLKYEITKKVELLWKLPLQSAIFATPKIVGESHNKQSTLKTQHYWNREILTCSIKGQLALVSLISGQLKALYELTGEVFSTPCLHEDYFYIGCRDNFLYCFALPPINTSEKPEGI